MNQQGRFVNDKVAAGIEWTKMVLPDGTERRGYTWNPVAGCLHDCHWTMPDGTVARCYAKTVAEGVASAAYPQGFEAHYWHPQRLREPLRVSQPSRIFLDSMSDLMGSWVPDEQVEAVLAVCREAHWHTFQLLTKNAPRLLKFDFPKNVWVGASMPPDRFRGRPLTEWQQMRMLGRALAVLRQVDVPVRWVSFEPLSWNVSGVVSLHAGAIQWAVIGAASNGRVLFQPDPQHVQWLLEVLDRDGVPVFFKGNLEWEPWREEFPG